MTEKIFTYIGLASIALLLLGLGGWYLFLRNQSDSVLSLDRNRGLDADVPTFFGSTGSTIANIASNLGIHIGSDAAPAQPPRFWRINATPVAGMAFLKGTSTIRFVERSTGYVVDADPISGSVVRRSNTLMPQTYAAYITGDGNIVAQTLTPTYTIETFTGSLSTSTVDGYAQLEGGTLIQNIDSVAVSPVSSAILYALRGSGPALLISSDLRGTSPRQLLTSAVSHWHIHWLTDSDIYLQERAASAIPGSLFKLLPSGALQSVLHSIPGLSALPHASSSAVLYSSDSGDALRLFLRPESTSSTIEIPLATLAEKCVWLSGESTTAWCAVPKEIPHKNAVDEILRGALHTSDSLWSIDSSGKTEEVFKINEVEPIEVTKPVVDSTSSFLAFINGWDQSLWVVRIRE